MNALALKRLLLDSKYDPLLTAKLVDGFQNGFELGYEGPHEVQLTSDNLKLRGLGTKTTLWNKVMKEVKLKRYAGPFETIPFKHFIQSPIGLVPKDNGTDVRLIFHLSHPQRGNSSVNANTPKHKASVKYPDFNKAVALCIRAGKRCSLSKSDFRSAFRNLCLRKFDWKFLIMKAVSPLDGKTYYFVDKCLPFGAAISCAVFQSFSNAISHIVRYKTNKENVNYLDDFIFIAMLKAMCDAQLDTFLQICQTINFPVSVEKTFWSCTQMTFLGFLIDTVRQLILIPVEKLNKAREILQNVLSKKKVTVRDLQKICGFLNFLGRCIVPGRAFTRRLYAYTAGNKLKPHHHIRINAEMRGDLTMWQTFVNHPTAYARDFIDIYKLQSATEISMFSDASKSKILGFGSICEDSWAFAPWPEHFIEDFDPSISYLELYALVTGVKLWIHRFKNKRILLFCDNQAAVQMVNETTSSCKHCMKLVRILVLESLIHNVRVYAKYIKSKENTASDLLSRMRIREFKQLKSSWEREPTALPEELWPINKLFEA